MLQTSPASRRLASARPRRSRQNASLLLRESLVRNSNDAATYFQGRGTTPPADAAGIPEQAACKRAWGLPQDFIRANRRPS